eukprot:360399-Chlamydomonas_euryale.AAC.3
MDGWAEGGGCRRAFRRQPRDATTLRVERTRDGLIRQRWRGGGDGSLVADWPSSRSRAALPDVTGRPPPARLCGHAGSKKGGLRNPRILSRTYGLRLMVVAVVHTLIPAECWQGKGKRGAGKGPSWKQIRSGESGKGRLPSGTPVARSVERPPHPLGQANKPAAACFYQLAAEPLLTALQRTASHRALSQLASTQTRGNSHCGIPCRYADNASVVPRGWLRSHWRPLSADRRAAAVPCGGGLRRQQRAAGGGATVRGRRQPLAPNQWHCLQQSASNMVVGGRKARAQSAREVARRGRRGSVGMAGWWLSAGLGISGTHVHPARPPPARWTPGMAPHGMAWHGMAWAPEAAAHRRVGARAPRDALAAARRMVARAAAEPPAATNRPKRKRGVLHVFSCCTP